MNKFTVVYEDKPNVVYHFSRVRGIGYAVGTDHKPTHKEIVDVQQDLEWYINTIAKLKGKL